MMVRLFYTLILSTAVWSLFALSDKPANKIVWPEPTYNFKRNPLDSNKVALGRWLFYDPILSKDSTISCASCHSPYTAFAHNDHALSHGISDRIGNRNAPSLFNLAWSKSFMWDGAVNHLDVQGLAPLENPLEMDEKLIHVVQKLQRLSKYRNKFKLAFGSEEITGEHLLKALAQFQLTLVSNQSKYDQVMAGKATFTETEASGYVLFQQHCALCHKEPLFTDQSFQNNGLEPDSILRDIGRMKITGKQSDSLKFKVPSLRNCERTGPYMHDGRYNSLQMVLFHYSSNIHASSTLNPRLKNGIPLSELEKKQLLAFLKTLTDPSFLHHKQHQFPMDLMKK